MVVAMEEATHQFVVHENGLFVPHRVKPKAVGFTRMSAHAIQV
jgi:hypothetical protein